jgi:hypothetical protein
MRPNFTYFIRFLGLLSLIPFFVATTAHADQLGVSWNGGTGDWSVASNWTPAAVPNNGSGAGYSVAITTPNSVVAMDVLFDAVNNVTLGDASTLNVLAGDSLVLVSGPSSSSGTLTINGGLSVSAEQATFTNMYGANLTNFGTLAVNFESFILNDSGADLMNNGTISLGFYGNGIGNSGIFINNAAISVAPDSSIGNGAGGVFSNFGTLDGDSWGLGNQGAFTNSGTIIITAGFDPAALSNSGTFNNNGVFNLSAGSFAGTFSNSGTFNNSGTLNVDLSCYWLCGGGTSNTGTLNNSGILNVTQSLAYGGGFTNSGTMNNSGSLLNGVGSTINNTGAVNNSGVFLNDGVLLDSGMITNSKTFTNSGALTVQSTGLFVTSSDYTQTGGSTTVDGTLIATNGAAVNIQAGTLGGDGIIYGNVTNGGTLAPGDALGTLTINGSYEQKSTGIFDELLSPESQSLLDVIGGVDLDPGASLEVSLLEGFDPIGQTFDIIDFATLEGQFSNGSSFWDDGYLWDLFYGQNQIDLTATQAPEPGSLVLLLIGLAVWVPITLRKLGNKRRLA